MKILIATALAALVGIGSFAAVDTSPASAAAVVVKIGPGHHHWQSRWYWHGRYWHHRHWVCRPWHHRRACAWRYW